MKYLILFLLLSCSALAEESKTFWLKRYVSVETESGIRGFPVGTIATQEGSKYRVEKMLVSIPEDALTDDPNVIYAAIEAIRKQIEVQQKAKAAEKPVATPKPTPAPTPRVIIPTGPQKMPPNKGGLQPSSGLDYSRK